MRLARLQTLASIVALGLAATAIGTARGRLARSIAAVKESSDAYALPPPEQLGVACLGYRAAAADLIWAYVLVSQGTHSTEHRRFDHAERYFWSIFALDPAFRDPYMLVDAILTFGSVRATAEATRETRQMLEYGVSQRPLDAQLLWQAGSFIAYIAPSYLPEEERAEWDIAGAKLLTRAAELGLPRDSMADLVAGANILRRQGQRVAARSALERALEITDDPATRNHIIGLLRNLGADASADRAKSLADRFGSVWTADLPFSSRSRYLLIGPPTDVFACAGPRPGPLAACAHDWRTWVERSVPAP